MAFYGTELFDFAPITEAVVFEPRGADVFELAQGASGKGVSEAESQEVCGAADFPVREIPPSCHRFRELMEGAKLGVHEFLSLPRRHRSGEPCYGAGVLAAMIRDSTRLDCRMIIVVLATAARERSGLASILITGEASPGLLFTRALACHLAWLPPNEPLRP